MQNSIMLCIIEFYSLLSRRHFCHKLSKSADVCRSYSVPHQCHFLGTQCGISTRVRFVLIFINTCHCSIYTDQRRRFRFYSKLFTSVKKLNNFSNDFLHLFVIATAETITPHASPKFLCLTSQLACKASEFNNAIVRVVADAN